MPRGQGYLPTVSATPSVFALNSRLYKQLPTVLVAPSAFIFQYSNIVLHEKMISNQNVVNYRVS